MPLEPGERDLGFVLDMILSADDALEFVAGLDEAAFFGSKLHQHAVVRAIEIIGEAAGRLSPEFRQTHSEVRWSDMTGMRHRLIHGYDKVRLEIVWTVVQEELPVLLQSLRRIIAPQ